MKPLRLELSGFTCFKEKTDLSFEELSLFAISGATGSGKSSILDAMVYALYGQTPRLGGRGLEALMNPQVDELFVLFEFEVGQDIFRVLRHMRRQKTKASVEQNQKAGIKQEVRIEQQDDDANWKQLPEVNAKEVAYRLNTIVGLDYDSFVRAVLLPQGAFDEFLRGSNSKRIELLIRLLGLEKITEIQKRAGANAKSAKDRMSFIQQQLDEDFEGVSKSAVTTKKDDLKMLGLEEKTLAKTRDTLNKEFMAFKELREQLLELQTLRKQLSDLKEQEKEIDVQRERLKHAQAAEKVMPLYTVAKEREKELSTLQLRFQEVEASSKRELGVFKELESLNLKAQEEAKSLEGINQKLEALAALGPRVERLKELGGNMGLATQNADGLTFSDKAWESLQEKKIKLPSLKKALMDMSEREKQYLREKARAEANKEEITKLEAQLEVLTENGKQSKDTFEAADKAYKTAVQENHANFLRKDLQVGDDCPICGKEIKELVQGGGEADLKILEKTFEDAKKALDELRTQFTEVREKLKGIKDKTLVEQEERLAESLKAFEQAKQVIEQLQTEFALDAINIDVVNNLEADFNKQSQSLLSSLAKSIQTESGGEDPETALLKLRKERSRIDEALKVSGERLQEQVRTTDKLKVEFDSLTKDVEKVQAIAKEKQDELQQALFANTFDSTDELERVYLSEAEQTTLREKLEKFEQQKQDAEREELKLSSKLGDKAESTLDEAAFVKLAEDRQSIEVEHNNLNQQLGTITTEIKQLEEKLERSKKLQDERKTLEEQASIFEQLNQDLRRDRFPEFLLTTVQEQLAFRASKIMRDTSDGRYDLKLMDGEYFVMDGWHTGELRNVKTLSGGETFMASLSLALALSETVAGHTVLGALFLDEGFGTLDSETLGSVATVLEALTEQGRMVGIITHVAELSERMPSVLHVVRGESSSEVKWSDGI